MTSQKPVVVAYRRDWPRRADVLISDLRESLGDGVDRIEHIGSTAIADMAAKDVIDLQASVSDLDEATRTLDGPLAVHGFERSVHQVDHIPAGQTDDQARWTKRLWVRRHHPDGDVNVHVRRSGAPNERLALLFRDWFRAHPESVPAYSATKTILAGATADVDTYSTVKDPIVDLIMVTAEEWARSVDWSP